MTKLEVGMYVRTKDGIIGKLQNKIYIGYSDFIIDTLYYNFDETIDKWTCSIKKYDIMKASHNIIDLIEVGDYVNGYKVISLWKDKTKVIGVAVDSSIIGFDECEINSIVTKEQFDAMKYEVKQ